MPYPPRVVHGHKLHEHKPERPMAPFTFPHPSTRPRSKPKTRIVPDMSIDQVGPFEAVSQCNGCAVPSIEDPKPPYTIPSLIAMAILDASDSQLTATQICQWISDRFPYYRLSDFEWRQSVTQIVNQDKSFTVLRRKDRQGCYYHSISPGVEFEVGEAEAGDNGATAIGMARLGIRSGRAKVVQL